MDREDSVSVCVKPDVKKTGRRPDPGACRTCTSGSCCYEGVELSAAQMRRILKYGPAVPKPWFRLVRPDEHPDKDYPFATVIRNGTCVFQDGLNRCRVYPVRPRFCREFPMENGRAAPFYKRLCVLFRDEWPDNAVRRTYLRREKKK